MFYDYRRAYFGSGEFRFEPDSKALATAQAIAIALNEVLPCSVLDQRAFHCCHGRSVIVLSTTIKTRHSCKRFTSKGIQTMLQLRDVLRTLI